MTPPRSGTQSVTGYEVLGRRVLRVQGLRGLQADATAAVAQQVIFLKTNVCLAFPLVHLFAPADLATAVYLIKVKWQKAGLGRNGGVEC